MRNRLYNPINPYRKTKYAPSMTLLNRLALKKIFDKLTYDEESALDSGIRLWSKDVIPTLSPNNKIIARKELKTIINALIENEDGKFDRTKDNYKRLEIDYRKAYPEGI